MLQKGTKKKYCLYVRKSTDSEDKQVASIESQVRELKKIAKRDNLRIVETFSESRSAKCTGRPLFDEMIKKIQKGKAQGIICWAVDRLSRNPEDFGKIQGMLQREEIRHIKTYDRDYYPSDNVLLAYVQFGMANQFIQDLSKNVKRGLRAKVEKGWLPSRAPLGYKNEKFAIKGYRRILKDSERFDLVRKMFDLILTGNYTAPRILDIAVNQWGLKNRWGQKIAPSSIYKTFTNTFYYGEFEYPINSGDWYPGKHTPMISRREYDEIQIILGRKGKPRPKRHSFAFTGLIKCGECGGAITAEKKIKRQKNGNVHRYVYYHCTKRKSINCSQKCIRKKDLEKQIEETLGNINIPPEFHEWAMGVLREENEKESEGRNAILSAQQKAYNACVKKIDNLIDMRAADEITEDEFKKKKREVLKEKSRFQELLNDTDNKVNNWLDKAEQFFNFARDASEEFKNGTLEKKKQILSCLGSNLVLKNKKLTIELEKSLVPIKQASQEVWRIHERLEPLKNRLNKKKIGQLYARNPLLYRYGESNPGYQDENLAS